MSAGVRQLLTPPVRTTSVALLPLPAPGGSALLRSSAPSLSPGTIVDPGYSFNLVGFVTRAGGDAPVVRFRTSTDGVGWSSWSRLTLERVRERGKAAQFVSEPYWCGTARYLQYVTSRRVKAAFVNSLGNADAAGRVATAVRSAVAAVMSIDLTGTAAAATAKPAIVTRKQWGANESWRKGSPSYGAVKFSVVHHTLGRNTYTQAEAPAVVRATYSYHARTNGWSDIGYNFLIDRFGTIYEGRYGGVTKAVVGAQCMGFNHQSTGISLLGDFTSVPPPTAALAALERLLAWKLDVHHIDPQSKATVIETANDRFKVGQVVKLPAICAHRTAAYTYCPGDAFMAVLPAIRKVVADTGLPKIYGLLASPAIFTPDGDLVDDQTAISFITSEQCSWTVKISDAGGVVVRTLAGAGQTMSVPWDGLDDRGVLVPDGEYTVAVDAAGPSGVARQAKATVTVGAAGSALSVRLPVPKVVNPDGGVAGTKTTVKYSLVKAAQTKIVVRDLTRAAVCVLQKWQKKPAGSQSVTWDGRTGSGTVRTAVAEGQYTIEVALRDSAGNELQRVVPVVVDRTIAVTDVAVKPVRPGSAIAPVANLPFTLARPAVVVMGIVGGATVRTVQLGTLPAGQHVASWDGLDDAGLPVNDGTYAITIQTATPAGDLMAAGKAAVDTRPPKVKCSGKSTAWRGRRVLVSYKVADADPKAKATVVVRKPGGTVLRQRTAKVPTGKLIPVQFIASARGSWTVSVKVVDWAGNRTTRPVTFKVKVR